jgi:DNA-binding FadR family transcriptional regulator
MRDAEKATPRTHDLAHLRWAKHRPLTATVAQELRQLSLAQPANVFLGSEKEFLTRFGVSRPTFRQAVNLVEQEQLVSVVRGVKGGIYSRRPDIGAVIASATAYLMTRETTLSDLLLTTSSLMADAAMLAAGCDDADLLADAAKLTAALVEGERIPQSLADFEADEMATITLLCAMSGNPSIELLLRVLYSLGVAAFPSIFDGREDLMQYRRTARILLLKAIAARDRDLAVSISRQNGVLSRLRIDDALLQQRMASL